MASLYLVARLHSEGGLVGAKEGEEAWLALRKGKKRGCQSEGSVVEWRRRMGVHPSLDCTQRVAASSLLSNVLFSKAKARPATLREATVLHRVFFFRTHVDAGNHSVEEALTLVFELVVHLGKLPILGDLLDVSDQNS